MGGTAPPRRPRWAAEGRAGIARTGSAGGRRVSWVLRPRALPGAAQVEQQVAALTSQARCALAGTLEQLAGNPHGGTRDHPRHPPEMLTAAFGDWGVLVYVISERHRRVIIVHVTWAQ